MTDIDHQRALDSVRAAVREQGRVSVFARTQRLVAAPVLSFDREEEGAATGIGHLPTALASDVVGGLARRHRVVLDGLEATLQAAVDVALTWLGVVAEENIRACARGHTSSVPACVRAQEDTPLLFPPPSPP